MPLPEGFILCRATTGDLDVLVEHRRAMFRDMGYSDETALTSMASKFRPWLLEHMKGGDYLAWLVSAPDGLASAHGWSRRASRQHPQRLHRG